MAKIMAFVSVPGSNGIWQYDNVATAAATYPDANGTYSAGVRSYAPPSGAVQLTYVSCRKTGETVLRGELNKNFYDQLNANGVP